MSEVLNRIEALELKNAALWLAEAKFGYAHVRPQIEHLTAPAALLEIGCGSGILLSMLAEHFPQHDFSGIEPFGDGFSALQELGAIVREGGVHIQSLGYEAFTSDRKFDCIFCVNVFEHVEDWKHFLSWVAAHLAPGGVFIALCPNYGFPYESHFRLPIIVAKSLTYKVFNKRIEEFERKHDVSGLWKSLNFVKKRDVKRFVERSPILGLEIQDDIDIIENMVRRMVSDPEFRKRQSVLGSVALTLHRAGLFRLVRLFPNQLPYMKLVFRKRAVLQANDPLAGA